VPVYNPSVTSTAEPPVPVVIIWEFGLTRTRRSFLELTKITCAVSSWRPFGKFVRISVCFSTAQLISRPHIYLSLLITALVGATI
jgi:hypothetical protein